MENIKKELWDQIDAPINTQVIWDSIDTQVIWDQIDIQILEIPRVNRDSKQLEG